MAIILTRKEETSSCTPGLLEVGDRTFPTIEQKDRNNEPFTSCIPLGEYDLVPYRSEKYGVLYVAVNEDLNVYHSIDSPGRPFNGRYKCLYFHRGNYAKNFQGCGGVGRKWIEKQEMITNTAETCAWVNDLIDKEGSFKMIIQHWWE